MKEKIEEKLQKNIERILTKEELSATDVAILKEELARINIEKNKEKDNGIMKEMLKLLANEDYIANVR